jgi:hypothetical protein
MSQRYVLDSIVTGDPELQALASLLAIEWLEPAS